MFLFLLFFALIKRVCNMFNALSEALRLINSYDVLSYNLIPVRTLIELVFDVV